MNYLLSFLMLALLSQQIYTEKCAVCENILVSYVKTLDDMTDQEAATNKQIISNWAFCTEGTDLTEAEYPQATVSAPDSCFPTESQFDNASSSEKTACVNDCQSLLNTSTDHPVYKGMDCVKDCEKETENSQIIKFGFILAILAFITF